MILTIAIVISMLVIGWVVWTTLQRQESRDDLFQEKLDRDDERARRGREAVQAGRDEEDPPEEHHSGSEST